MRKVFRLPSLNMNPYDLLRSIAFCGLAAQQSIAQPIIKIQIFWINSLGARLFLPLRTEILPSTTPRDRNGTWFIASKETQSRECPREPSTLLQKRQLLCQYRHTSGKGRSRQKAYWVLRWGTRVEEAKTNTNHPKCTSFFTTPQSSGGKGKKRAHQTKTHLNVRFFYRKWSSVR